MKISVRYKVSKYQYCNFCEPKGLPQKGQLLDGRDASPGGLSDWSRSQVKAETKGHGHFDLRLVELDLLQRQKGSIAVVPAGLIRFAPLSRHA